MDEVDSFLQSFAESTRNSYATGIKLFEQFYGKPITEFIKQLYEDLQKPPLERTRIGENVMRNYEKWLERKYAPASVPYYMHVVQSFARYESIPLPLRYIKMPKPIPTNPKFKWDLDTVAAFISLLREPIKSVAVVMLQSGLAVGDVLNLRVEDLYDMGNVPMALEVTRKKTGVHFYTFVGKWGVKHIINSIQATRGPVFPIGSYVVQYEFKMKARALMKYKGTNPMRPHSLRAAFRSFLFEGGVDPLYAEFFMGHRIPEERATYINIPLEGWRKIYAEKCEPLLTPKKWESI